MVAVTGGDKAATALRDRLRMLTNAKQVDVGFLENATYPDGTSVPLVAMINEYGAPSRNQPPRPFFRRMIAQKSPEWPSAIANLLANNNYDAKTTLDQVGAAVKGQLQQSIVDLVSPPLSPVTIARKGFDKPLIDTSHMLKSVDYKVK
jgi:hypothetical protein